MKYSSAYHDLDNNEYYMLTQFEKTDAAFIDYNMIKNEEKIRGEAFISKFEVSKNIFIKLVDYVNREGIRTREAPPKQFDDGVIPHSFTVYTINFELHAIKGNRGGWFIISRGGREPIINNEFIAYGSMRKSGTRRGRYRRNLSQTEKRQVEHLSLITPKIEKLYEWVSKKYPAEVKKVSLWYSDDSVIP